MYSHQYPDYDKRLMRCFPQLKPKELHYAMCVHYGLSDEKTAQLFEIQLPSIRKKRQRLRHVLDLMVEDDLRDFLISSLTKRSDKIYIS